MSSAKLILLLLLLGVCSNVSAQQLLINEISQGTGSREYVEFIVVGTPTCQIPVPCIDLRGMVLDDNNGDFGAGSGQGIAPGAIRFANIPFWSCVPQGTLIVIYNNEQRNPAIPADDASLTDGNCRLIIPINSLLIEGQAISPVQSITTTYPANSSWIAGGGIWNQVAMANSDDSFQIRQSITSVSALHAVSWGMNTSNNQIYFSGAAGGKVFSMMNTTNNSSFAQSNWTSGLVGVNETPGVANSVANDAWIGSMNPQCGVSNTMTLTMSSTPTGCGNPCTGTAGVTIAGGTAPYSYAWSNGGSSASLTALCAGTYTLTVTDFNNCQASDQVTVTNSGSAISLTLTPTAPSCSGNCDAAITSSVSGSSGTVSYVWSNAQTSQNINGLCAGAFSLTVTDQLGCSATSSTNVVAGPTIADATITTSGPFGNSDAPVQFTSITSGGIWTADCGSCMSTSGVFNPSGLAPGIYEVCHLVGSLPCTDNDCVNITIIQGCIPQTTSENTSICPGLSILFNGQTLSSPGTYSGLFTGLNGCDSTHTIILSNYSVTPVNNNYDECLGDSVLIDNTWYFTSQIITTPFINSNGCATTITHNLVFEDCTIPEFSIFIPNTFTPNGDLANDLFPIEFEGATLDYAYILNRWGEEIYEFSPSNLTWDGRTRDGNLSPDGVYTYVVQVVEINGKKNTYHGFVTLIR